jgi:hypothetical protein
MTDKVRRRGLVTAPELEAVIAEEPFDEDRWMVLEDRLLELGDPRAGIVAAQHTNDPIELAKAYDRVAGELLGKRFRTLRKYGGLGDWRAGFCRRLELDKIPRGALDELLALPALALVREVELAPPLFDPEPGWLTLALMPLTYGHELPALRRLELQYPGPISERSLGRLRLHELSCNLIYGVDLEPCEALAGLRYLACAPVCRETLATIAAELPRLRELVVAAHSRFALAADDLAVLFGTGALETLAIRKLPFERAQAVLEALAGTPLLAHLRVLELTDLGPRVEIAPAELGPAFAHLERVVVTRR